MAPRGAAWSMAGRGEGQAWYPAAVTNIAASHQKTSVQACTALPLRSCLPQCRLFRNEAWL